MIYLDAAATSLHKPPQVGTAMAAALGMGNAGRGAHSHAMAAAQTVYNGRKTIASFFGVLPQQVAFTSGATESLNIAIRGVLQPDSHVVTTVLEHNSVLRPLYAAGVDMDTVGLLPNGDLDYAAFARCLKPNTKAVVITTASNVTGLVVDMGYVAEFCKKHGLLLIVDAAQTAGVTSIFVGGIDILCFTGHKCLLGPQGIGGMVVRPGLNIAPSKFGGSGSDSFSHTQPAEMPEMLEAGTLNLPGIAGLAAGVEYITAMGITNIFTKAQELAEQFYNQTAKIPGIKLYSNFALPHAPIVALNIGDIDSAMVEFILSNEYGISARGGAHCAPLIHTALGTAAQGAVRFSFSHFNTAQEVETAVRAITNLGRHYGQTKNT